MFYIRNMLNSTNKEKVNAYLKLRKLNKMQ